MMYSFLHVLLLVVATLGVWMLRSRVLVAVICFLIFPAPAALFHFYAIPNPAATMVDPVDTSADDCNPSTPPPTAETAPPPKQGDEAEGGSPDPTTSCAPTTDNSRRQTFLAVLLVNYMTVLIGLVAGFLARSRATPKPPDDPMEGQA